MFQNKAMDIVFHYLDYQNNIDVRLGFAAVRVSCKLPGNCVIVRDSSTIICGIVIVKPILC